MDGGEEPVAPDDLGDDASGGGDLRRVVELCPLLEPLAALFDLDGLVRGRDRELDKVQERKVLWIVTERVEDGVAHLGEGEGKGKGEGEG